MESGVESRLRLVFFPDFDRLSAPPSAESPWYRDRVRAAVEESLTPKQREVVELYYFLGWSEPKIATHLGIRQQVVHKRLHGDLRKGRRVGGALGKLRKVLAPLAQMQGWV